MALVDSLLTAMVRADGDALVMHVGERPIVVSGSRTVDLSNHGMNLGAMVGMLGQLLSLDAQALLRELGAVEYELPSRESDRFSVVAARSGDDIWIEIRRRREALTSPPASQTAALPPAAPVDADAAAGADAADADAVETESPPALSDEPDSVAPDPEAAISEAGDREAAPAAPAAVTESSVSAEAGLDTDVEPAGVPDPVVIEEPLGESSAVALAGGEDEPTSLSGESMIAAIEVVDEDAAATVVAETASVGEDEVTDTPGAEEPRPESIAEPAHVEPGLPAALEHSQGAADQSAPIASVASASAEAGDPVQSPAEAPVVPALASAATSWHPVSTLASGLPMDAARHHGHSAGGPPPESASPVTPSEPASSGAGDSGSTLAEAPVTRTVRIEVPDRASPTRATGIDRLLRAADAIGASELFLVSQSRPYVRAGGNVRPLQDEPMLLGSDIEALIADVTPEPWRDAVRRGDPADWLIELPEVGRVRCATFRDHRGPGANFHFSFLRAASADDLQLSAETRRLATEPDGLVLVSGPAGSETAAIVAAFVDLLNQQRADYVITLEPQVRILHANREALVSQREVGSDPGRAAAAALAALREQPDVLVIESLGSGELAQLAIDAAAQSRLVIVSIEAASAAAALQRLVELVPADHRSHARHQLSRSFRGAVAQLMLRKASGGKIAARELLTSTRVVSGLLADGELPRLAEQLESEAAASMAPIADTVVDYVRSGLVDVREAVRKAPDAARLVDRLKAAGADLSALDGLN